MTDAGTNALRHSTTQQNLQNFQQQAARDVWDQVTEQETKL